MAKKKKYYPLTPREIEIYKRETGKESFSHAEMVNIALIALRKRYLDQRHEIKKIEKKIVEFNKMMRGTDPKKAARLIHFFMKD
jgi:hypothetical protein